MVAIVSCYQALINSFVFQIACERQNSSICLIVTLVIQMVGCLFNATRLLSIHLSPITISRSKSAKYYM